MPPSRLVGRLVFQELHAKWGLSGAGVLLFPAPKKIHQNAISSQSNVASRWLLSSTGGQSLSKQRRGNFLPTSMSSAIRHAKASFSHSSTLGPDPGTSHSKRFFSNATRLVRQGTSRLQRERRDEIQPTQRHLRPLIPDWMTIVALTIRKLPWPSNRVLLNCTTACFTSD